MKMSNIERVEYAKTILNSWNIIFRELANGQLQVNGANFWATSEKWHDPKSDTKGVGLDSFVKHIRSADTPMTQEHKWELVQRKAQEQEGVDDSWKLAMVDFGHPMSSACASYRLTNVVSGENKYGQLYSWRS